MVVSDCILAAFMTLRKEFAPSFPNSSPTSGIRRCEAIVMEKRNQSSNESSPPVVE